MKIERESKEKSKEEEREKMRERNRQREKTAVKGLKKGVTKKRRHSESEGLEAGKRTSFPNSGKVEDNMLKSCRTS